VNIINLCTNTKLTSPIYFGDGVVCPKLSGQQIDIGTKMNASFEINAIQDNFEGALLFKLQRYSDNQCNMDTSTTETNKNESMDIHMLAAWKVKDSKPFAYVTLVEHTREFAWNEDKLKKLYYENLGWFKEYDDTISDTRLIDNNMVLRITFSARDLERTPELSISISEEEKSSYTMKPFRINLER
jgi:hypothetical protein